MVGRALDSIQPGGLGLHLIRTAFDHVDYRPKQNGMELVLTKKKFKAVKSQKLRVKIRGEGPVRAWDNEGFGGWRGLSDRGRAGRWEPGVS